MFENFDFVTFIETILNQPEVISAIVLFALGLIGRAPLEKIPFFGVFVKILGQIVDALEDNLMAARERAATAANVAYKETLAAAAETATKLVEGQEQLKTIGKTDGAVAAATVTSKLVADFDLEEDVARMLTERAVRELHLP